MLELSLKPQNSTSWLYTTTADFTNFIADGTLFGSVDGYTNLTYTGGSSIAVDEAMIISPPIGNWRGYYQSGGVFASDKPQMNGQVKYPTIPSIEGYVGILLCNSTNPTFGGNSGIYQRIYGLSTGSSYTITTTINSPASIDIEAAFVIGDKVSGELETFTPVSGNSDYVISFTATDNYADIYIDLYGKVAECFIVKEVKCTELFTEADLTFSDFQDGSVVLDLYEDSIPLTLSVSSFTDATSNLQSYSKDFLLPASKRNDKIFSHIYDLNTTIEGNVNAFNPYIQTVATLKEDGVEIFSGELTMSAIIKNNEGISYDVHLESRISGLAKVLEGRKFEDINLSELDHNYTKTNIVNSWTTGIELVNNIDANSKAYDGSLTSTTVLKYPAVDWTGDLQDPNQNGNLVLTKLEEFFRPFINIKYIFERIVSEAGFTFESNFMNTPEFTKLFMDFNHGKEDGSSVNANSFGGSKFKVQYNGGGRWLTPDFTRFVFDNNNIAGNNLAPVVGQTYWDTSDNSFKPLVDGTSFHLYGQIPCYNDSGSERGVSFRTVHEKLDGSKQVIHTDSVDIASSSLSDPNEHYAPNLTVTLDLGDSLYFEGKTSTSDNEKVRQTDASNGNDIFDAYMYFDDISSVDSNMNTLLKESRGDVSQWNFIKSLINMFNLIISPSNERPNHLIIEPYNSVFGLGYRGNTIEDGSFDSGTVGEFTTLDSGVLTSASPGSLKVHADGTQPFNYHSAYSNYHNFVDGEVYTMSITIAGMTNSGRIDCQIHNGSNYFASLYAMSAPGTYATTFTFDKSANSNEDDLRIRLKMRDGNSFAYNVTITDISVSGYFQNDIIKKDWSAKVDMDSFNMKPLDLSNAVNFSCVKDDDDYSSGKLSDKVSTAGGKGYNYGDLIYQATDYTNLSGLEEVKNLVFASTIIKEIGEGSSLATFITPSIYKGEDDGNFTYYKNKPRILYDNGVKTTSSTFTSPTPSQNDGLAGFTNQSEYLLFTHFSDFDLLSGAPHDAQDINWTNCFSFVNNYSINNLFSEYWGGYYNEIYHPDTRIYTIECLLNHNDISNFKFNDIIVVENSEFRVNNINYNSEGLSKIELIKLP